MLICSHKKRTTKEKKKFKDVGKRTQDRSSDENNQAKKLLHI